MCGKANPAYSNCSNNGTNNGNNGTVTVSYTVKITQSSVTMYVGESITLNKSTSSNLSGISPIWTSNNSSVATVNSSGMVIGVKAGTATVTLKYVNTSGVTLGSASCIITVNSVIKESHFEMENGKIALLTKNNSEGLKNCTYIAWASSNETVAAIDKTSGLITAKKAGYTFITLTYTINGKSVTGLCEVVVKPKPVNVVYTFSSSIETLQIYEFNDGSFLATTSDGNSIYLTASEAALLKANDEPVVTSGNPPTEKDGFIAPKGWTEKKEPAPNGQYGWKDQNGNIWVPAPTGSGLDHGGGHWDVQNKNGNGYVNKYPDGFERQGKGERPNIPRPSTNSNFDVTEVVADTVSAGLAIYVTYLVIKWGIAVATAPVTVGGSITVAVLTP